MLGESIYPDPPAFSLSVTVDDLEALRVLLDLTAVPISHEAKILRLVSLRGRIHNLLNGIANGHIRPKPDYVEPVGEGT